MKNKPAFPTQLHENTARLVADYFLNIPAVDTVLLVNSTARGKAVPESDLDFAILVKPGLTQTEIKNLETDWQTFSENHTVISEYKKSGPFAHLHLDIIDGQYTPGNQEAGEPIDYFEIEIGNQICHSLPMDKAGSFYQELQKKWLPYYNEELRMRRLALSGKACRYDLDHIPYLIKRGLHFHAFDILYKAFQKYLQTLFIANKTYPIAYNKWIKEQVVEWLDMPELYPQLSTIISIPDIETDEINHKAKVLGGLLNDLTNGSE
jgi:predicted nucleotidyltransferase